MFNCGKCAHIKLSDCFNIVHVYVRTRTTVDIGYTLWYFVFSFIGYISHPWHSAQKKFLYYVQWIYFYDGISSTDVKIQNIRRLKIITIIIILCIRTYDNIILYPTAECQGKPRVSVCCGHIPHMYLYNNIYYYIPPTCTHNLVDSSFFDINSQRKVNILYIIILYDIDILVPRIRKNFSRSDLDC